MFAKYQDKFFCIFIFVFIVCCRCVKNEIKSITDETLILNRYGSPKSQKYVKLYNGVRLYEYQNSLYNIFPRNVNLDTLVFKESIWVSENSDKIIFWFFRKDNSWFVVDSLKWDKYTKF